VREARVETDAFKIHEREGTGSCLSFVTPDSQRTMRTFLGASATLKPDEITRADFDECTHAHIEGYLLFNEELMIAVLQKAREAGCTVSLDLASPEVVRAKHIMLPGLLREYVDMVFANEDEAAAFAGTADEKEAHDKLSAFCPLAAVKVGARGSLIKTEDDVVLIPAKHVHAVDTTGAGDLWAAGFLYGLLSGRDAAESGRIASHTGAAVVEEVGAAVPDAVWIRLKQDLALSSRNKKQT